MQRRQRRPLQAAIRKGTKAEVEAEEKAEKQAQKQKEILTNKASKDVLAKAKGPKKAKKAPIRERKVVQFVGVDLEEVVPATSQKQTSLGRAVKAPVIFEKGT